MGSHADRINVQDLPDPNQRIQLALTGSYVDRINSSIATLDRLHHQKDKRIFKKKCFCAQEC